MCDITKYDEIKEINKQPKIDILINNAEIIGQHILPKLRKDMDIWSRLIQ